MELETLIQGKDELDVDEVIEFIEKQENRKFVLIYSALKDEMTRLNFFTYFLKKNKYEFLACNFSGFITNTGYYNDAIAVCVFSGDFQAEVFHEPIEYENIEETIKQINEKTSGQEICLVYSASLFKNNHILDKILRGVQKNNPEMMIHGGVCSPPPFMATKEGILDDIIGLILLKGLDYSFDLYSGFQLDQKSVHEYTITKSDEKGIYEINGRNAAEEYQKIQHVRDYLFNRIMDLCSREDAINFPKYFKKANNIIFKVVDKSFKSLLGSQSEHLFINPLVVTQIEKNKIKATNSRLEGTVLRKTKSDTEKQLRVYDKIGEKHSQGKAMILIDCAMRLFYYNYQTDEAYNRLKKIKYPFIAPQVYGEIGNYTPYHPKENIIHNATVKALVFK